MHHAPARAFGQGLPAPAGIGRGGLATLIRKGFRRGAGLGGLALATALPLQAEPVPLSTDEIMTLAFLAEADPDRFMAKVKAALPQLPPMGQATRFRDGILAWHLTTSPDRHEPPEPPADPAFVMDCIYVEGTLAQQFRSYPLPEMVPATEGPLGRHFTIEGLIWRQISDVAPLPDDLAGLMLCHLMYRMSDTHSLPTGPGAEELGTMFRSVEAGQLKDGPPEFPMTLDMLTARDGPADGRIRLAVYEDSHSVAPGVKGGTYYGVRFTAFELAPRS
jgi:hypothetical protein